MNDALVPAGLALFSRLRAAEAAQDASIMAKVDLLGTMLEARDQVKPEFGTGQAAMEHAARALSAEIEGPRRSMVHSHARLAEVAIAVGFDWRMAGDHSATRPPDQFLFEPSGAVAPAEVV